MTVVVLGLAQVSTRETTDMKYYTHRESPDTHAPSRAPFELGLSTSCT